MFLLHTLISVFQKVRLNSTHYLITKIHNKKECKQIAIDNSADIDYKDFLKIYKNCKNETYSFLTIYTTFPADNLMRLRKNFSDSPL